MAITVQLLHNTRNLLLLMHSILVHDVLSGATWANSV